MTRIRRHLTYANVISSLALFLVLSGGAAYAASHLARNSVGTRQLKRNAVTGAKVRNGSLRGADVADGSLTGADLADRSLSGAQLADGSLTGAKIADGSLTGADVDASTLGQVPSARRADGAAPTGPAGGDLAGTFPDPTIADGAVTAAKLADGIPHGVHVVSLIGGNSSSAEQGVVAKCPPGEQVIGGGALAPFFGATGFVALSVDGPVEEVFNSGVFNEWEAKAIEVNGGSTQSWSVGAYAICAGL